MSTGTLSETQFSRVRVVLVDDTRDERWDGSSYPQGLHGEDIPIEGRLVAIAGG